jgi:hypothetical protein
MVEQAAPRAFQRLLASLSPWLFDSKALLQVHERSERLVLGERLLHTQQMAPLPRE